MKRLIVSVALTGLMLNMLAQTNPNAAEVMQLTRKVADWQLQNPSGKGLNTWEYGTFYSGLMDLYKTTKDQKYYDALLAMGNTINWELRPRPYDANVYAIGHALFELYEMTGDSTMIDKVRYAMDMPLMRWLEPEVTFEDNKYWWEWWTWCDALFMAPPTYVRGAVLLDKPEYLNYMVKMWKLTSDYLYSQEDSLYFRDDRFFDKQAKNGAKVFWSRGNGWVIGGLCKVLDYLPKEHPDRPFFEQQFLEMAKKVATIQLDNGSWSPSLLYPDYGSKIETSGTAFFCYGITWGINNGLLAKEEFVPAVLKAWNVIEKAVEKDGKLGYVQRVGDQPDAVKREDTETYGTGAVILAGSELYELFSR